MLYKGTTIDKYYPYYSFSAIKNSALDLDTTLSRDGAPADAGAVGKALENININTDKTLTKSNKPADAKVVGDIIENIKTATIISSEETYSDSILNKLTWTSGYVDVNGSTYSNSTYQYSSKLEVNSGDIIQISRTYGTYTDIRFVTAYINDTAVPSLGADGVSTYTVPEGVSEIILTVYSQGMSVYTLIHKYKKEVYKNIYEDEINKIKDGIAPEMITNISRIGHNYVNDIIEEENGKYWNSQIGRTIQLNNNSAYIAILIPITKEGIYNFSSVMRFIHLLDNTRTVIEVLNSKRAIDTTNKNASYLALTVYKEDRNSLQIALNDEPTSTQYVVEDEWVFKNLKQLNNRHIYLPKEICVGVGRTIELYNNLVFLEAEQYHINWQCSVGIAYKRKFSITGTASNVGTYTLTLNIYDDSMSLIDSKTSIIKIVENSLTETKNIIPIGDSLTNQKGWEPEVQTLSNEKIAYIGTRQGAYNRYKHEGRSGATAHWYNADSTYTYDSNYVGNPDISGTSNPFWDGSKFSLSHYIETQSETIGVPDAVSLLLGTNGIATDPTNNVNEIKTIVDNIISEYPSMPIFVCNTIYRSNQDGYHSTGADGYIPVSDFQFSADIKIMNLQNALMETFSEYENVYIVPLSICMDRDNNFGQVEVPVNPRLTTITTNIASESVHPQSAGYLQMADVMYSSYIAHLT